jgi:hypothetical protein
MLSAVVVCGEYPTACINFFRNATGRKDTLRDIAHYFASKWTERFAGTQEFSAVHLVGFERITGSGYSVPQMWFWCNGLGPDPNRFKSKDELEAELATFSEPIPSNNHIPWKIKGTTGKFPGSTLEEERSLVMSFLRLHEPFFTWNGDTQFWRSASNAVGSAMNLLWREKSAWTIDEVGRLTGYCLRFLANVGTLLPESTVGLSQNEEFDIIAVTPNEIKKLAWAKLHKP